jgi:hypothetical protein
MYLVAFSRSTRATLRRFSGIAWLAAASVATAQTAEPPAGGLQPYTALVRIGSPQDDSARVAQLTRDSSDAGYLLRSISLDLARRLPADGSFYLRAIAPELRVVRNSAIPTSLNEGDLWAGRGIGGELLAGAHLAYGPVSLVVAPSLVYQQNEDFPLFQEPFASPDTSFSAPWYTGLTSADLPLRFGEDPSTRVTPGESSLTVSVGPASVGIASEHQWWGPGIRNALVLSSNAPGFPHLFLNTRRPLTSRFGTVEAKWIVGVLTESSHFDTIPGNDFRSLSGLVVTYSPPGEPNVALGVSRAVYGPQSGGGLRPGRLAEVLTRWDMRGDVRFPEADASPSDFREQVSSIFGRWTLPADGLEVYAEWARQRLPGSISELFEQPNFSQAYTVGLQGSRQVGAVDLLRAQVEFTDLEQTSRTRSDGIFYGSPAVVQGYTNEGRVLGAAIGPGSSSQWLALDYLSPRWRVGVFGNRIRWANDQYYLHYNTHRNAHLSYLGHDVSMLAGIRGGARLLGARWDVELSTEKRYNYLFQNRGQGWETAEDAVDVRNYTVKIGVSPTFTVPAASVPAPAQVEPPAAVPSGM